MDVKRLTELLTRLRNELGSRAKRDYVQLFGPSTIRKVSRLIQVLNGDAPLTDNSLLRLMESELVGVLEDAGVTPRKSVHDSAESLKEIRDIVSELNGAANRGVFGNTHKVTYLTNDIKSWLTRDIENLQQITNNRPW